MATHSITELDYALNVFEKAMLNAQFRFADMDNYIEISKAAKRSA